MKKIFIIAFMLFAGNYLFAQKTKSSDKKNEISFNIGVAVPGGNFSKANYADPASGYAKSGLHLNLSGSHYFNKNWGAGLMIGYSQYGTRGAQSLADGYKEDSGTDSTTLYSIGHTNSLSVLVGPYFRIPAGKSFSVNLRAMIGYVNTHLAGFKIFYEDYLDNFMTQDKSSGGGLGLQFGVDANYKITKMIFIKAGVDYFYSKPRLDISYQNFIVNSGRKLASYDEALPGVNATLGLGFAF